MEIERLGQNEAENILRKSLRREEKGKHNWKFPDAFSKREKSVIIWHHML